MNKFLPSIIELTFLSFTQQRIYITTRDVSVDDVEVFKFSYTT